MKSKLVGPLFKNENHTANLQKFRESFSPRYSIYSILTLPILLTSLYKNLYKKIQIFTHEFKLSAVSILILSMSKVHLNMCELIHLNVYKDKLHAIY